ncbi:hypothetical protein ACIQF6_16430 [Kitasatospora sp. NPDC092948]|uniref:hypothetical protein n=1 Tax=Kitasatospora sp. NPDC092948 TaxID=3364088 RepID=UPI0038114DBC
MQDPPGPGGGGLPAIGVLLLVQAVSMIGVLVYDLVRVGTAYLPTAIGISYQHIPPAPVAFGGADIAFLLATLALAFGAFAGGRWTRGAAVVLGAVHAFGAWSQLVNLFTAPGSDTRFVFEPVGHLLLALTLVLTVVLALITTIVVTATRTLPARAEPFAPVPFDPEPAFPGPAAPAPYGPPPGAPGPGSPAPGAWVAPPQPGYGPPSRPPQPPNPYLSQPPAGGPGASYAYPPQPPAAPPAPPAPPNRPPDPYR